MELIYVILIMIVIGKVLSWFFPDKPERLLYTCKRCHASVYLENLRDNGCYMCSPSPTHEHGKFDPVSGRRH